MANMARRARRARRVAIGVAVLALGAGCDRSPVDPADHDELGMVEIVDNDTDQVLATWTHDDGWDAAVLTTLSHAAEAQHTRAWLGIRMWTEDGAPIVLSLDGEYSARYRVHSDPGGVLDTSASLDLFQGDSVYLYGRHSEGLTGTAQIAFQLFHGTHSDGDTDPIAVVITD